jgi:hypothetical protein
VGGGYNGRVKRWLFTILSAVSLLLFVAVVVMWVRSYRTKDAYSGSDGFRMQALVSHRGWMSWSVQHVSQQGQSWPWQWISDHADRAAVAEITLPSWQQRLGIGWENYSDPGGANGGLNFRFSARYLAYRILAAVFVLLPAVWTVRMLRRTHAPSRGHCATCGYDLRATPGRCPECGMVAEEARLGHAAKR